MGAINKKLIKLGVQPDTHAPYHSERNFNVFCEALDYWKPDLLLNLGDFVDFYAVSFHDKSPTRKKSLEWEISVARKCREQMDKLAKKRHMVFGNHEYRLERYISQNAAALHGLITVEDLLELKQNKWTWTPYRETYKLGKFNITHDTGHAGRQAVNKAVDFFGGNAIIGHVHSMSMNYSGNAKETHLGASFGHLLDEKYIDYQHKTKAFREWHPGFGIGYMEDNGNLYMQAIPIIQGKCCIEGKLIK